MIYKLTDEEIIEAVLYFMVCKDPSLRSLSDKETITELVLEKSMEGKIQVFCKVETKE